MREKAGLLVGMDICEDYVQLTYYDNELLSPESVSRGEGEEQYLIPARLAYRKSKNDWIIGDELDKEESGDIVEVQDFIKYVCLNEEIRVCDKTYKAEQLMKIFLEALLNVLNSFYPFNEIEYLGITFPTVTKEMSYKMSAVLKELGFEKEKYILLTHDEAFLYYTINQKIELWLNDTALFELEEDGLHFRILTISKKLEPITAKISKKEKAEKLNKSLVRSNQEESANLFHTLSLMALEESTVSTIYAVGRGFIDAWADGVLRKLSPGRRIFRGQNLYAKGACLAAKDKTSDEPTDIVLMEEDKTTVGFSLMAVKDGKNTEITLLKPALKWYEAETEIDLIIKDEDELGIQINDFITKKTSQRFILFSGISTAEAGLTRIRLSLKFTNRDTCIIKASDMGFGSFVPTTNRVWELIWEK